jgi:hypothetical protein
MFTGLDVVLWLLGAVPLVLIAWVVYRAFARPNLLDDPVLAEALSTLSPVEQWLWRDVVRRNLANPGTRLSLMVPKYGIKAATQSVIANMWALVTLLVLPATSLLEGHELGTAGEVIGWVFVGIAVAAALFGFRRVWTALRASRRYRKQTGR